MCKHCTIEYLLEVFLAMLAALLASQPVLATLATLPAASWFKLQVACMQPPADQGDRRPGILSATCCGASGQSVRLRWKCSRQASPGVIGLEEARWEFRRVLASLSEHQELRDIIKNQKDKLPPVFKSLGLDYDEHVSPSRHALAKRAGRNKVLNTAAAEQEWVITTAGIVVWLQHWCTARRRVADRCTAQLVSHAFFEACLDPGVAKDLSLTPGAHHLQLWGCFQGWCLLPCWQLCQQGGRLDRIPTARGQPKSAAGLHGGHHMQSLGCPCQVLAASSGPAHPWPP